jgi:hypothetical protein
MNLTRRTFALTGAAALLRADSTAPEPPALLLLSDTEARRIRGSLIRDRAAVLDKLAAEALKAGPWSVTSHRPSGLGVTAGEHDYVSEGPYWWPDPANPGGPFIRKDGQRNPDRFMGNRSDLGAMCGATLALGMGAYFLNKPEYAERAALVISTWFIDSKTRMNPNLEFGQMVRGVNTGRGTGIIDTVSLIQVAQGIRLAEASGGVPRRVSDGVRQWFADYLKWMTTSEKGLDEKKATNNHATWWTAQVAAYAAFAGDSELRRMAWDRYSNYLVPGQIQPDGSCPREEARTQSLGYSAMNLDAFSIICRLGAVGPPRPMAVQDREGNRSSEGFRIPHALSPASRPVEEGTNRALQPGRPLLSRPGRDRSALFRTALGLPEDLAAFVCIGRSSSIW